MDLLKKYKSLILLFIGIILYVLSYPPFNLSFLIFFSLVPLFLLIPEINTKEAFIFGFLYGFGFNGVNFYWIPSLISHFTPVIIGVLVNLLLISYLSLYYGIFLWAVKKKEDSILFPAFLMVLIQWIRAHGPLAFNWGSFGEPLVHIPSLLQWASIFGELGLTFLVVIVNVLIARHRSLNNTKKVLGIISLLLIFLIGNFMIEKEEDIYWRVGAVQGNYDSFSKVYYPNIEEQFEVHRDLTLKLPKNLDLIVWAESVIFYPLNQAPNYMKEIRELTEEMDSPILLGALETRGTDTYNSAYLFKKNGEYEIHRKSQLVPFVEEIPFPFNYIVPEYFKRLIGNYGKDSKYYSLSLEDKKIGVLICFESLFSDLGRALSQDKSDLLVVITNDGWFQGTPAVYQHKNQSLIRAVENRLPLVQVANTGITFFADPYGRIINESKEGEKNVYVGLLPKKGSSIYSVVGDLPIFLAFIIFLLFKVKRP
ncbi:MAG TPA: apolipoprotein N-acyltransferase [Dictyoglomaceae bacterium]|nr:apolipoprotein N-acyltransferase [Dictyoglomaceae bacterium]